MLRFTLFALASLSLLPPVIATPAPEDTKEQTTLESAEEDLKADDARRWRKLVERARQRRLSQRNSANNKPNTKDLPPVNGKIEGEILGLTIPVQFPDDPETAFPDPISLLASKEDFERFCNEIGYRDFGNLGSVKEYLLDQSGGLLSYNQRVSEIVTLPNPRNFYNYEDYPTNSRLRRPLTAGRLMVRHAAAVLKEAGFDFSGLTKDPDNFDGPNEVLATNIFFAGNTSGVFNQGLWPHRGSLSGEEDVGTPEAPLFLDRYQITEVKNSSLELGTYLHETCHLLFGFPDLYDLDQSSSGIGEFALMASGGFLGNSHTPSPICAYLKEIAGWCEVVDIVPELNREVTLRSTGDLCYRVFKKGSIDEFFIIENRDNGDRWAINSPDKGLIIWHVDECSPNNQDESRTASNHYRVSLEQADGRYDLEWDRNRGDARDLFSATSDPFSPSSNPSSNWWDGTSSGLTVDVISRLGNFAQVRFGDLAADTVEVKAPNGSEALVPGATTDIVWSANVAGPVTIELYRDQVLQTLIASNEENDSHYRWTIDPNLAHGSGYQIKISQADAPSVHDFSDVSFDIGPEQFPLDATTPTGFVQVPGNQATWELVSDHAIEGIRSLRSQDIGENSVAAIQTSGAYEAGQVAFQVKVSSEKNFDFLRFFIDGVQRYESSGERGWQKLSFLVNEGIHTFEWQYVKDAATDTGDDAVWIDDFVPPPLYSGNGFLVGSPGNGALLISGGTQKIIWVGGKSNDDVRIDLLVDGLPHSVITERTENDGTFTWNIPPWLTVPGNGLIRIESLKGETIAGESPGTFSVSSEIFPAKGFLPTAWTVPASAEKGWSIDTKTTAEGVMSLKSDQITDTQTAAIQLTRRFQAGTISFQVKISSEETYDEFLFLIDGVPQTMLSGELDWQRVEFPVSAGEHTLEWLYQKDSSVSNGDDAAWIDHLVLPEPENLLQLARIRDDGSLEPTTSISFGTVPLGNPDELVTLRLSNSSGTALSGLVYNLDRQLGGSENVQTSSALPSDLAADSHIDLTFRFSPSEAGLHGAELRIACPNKSQPEISLVFTGSGFVSSALSDWRLNHFPGLLGSVVSTYTYDADSDGFTNLEEFILGTDPRAAGNTFTVSGGSLNTGTFRLPITTKAGWRYSMQRSTNQLRGEWETVSQIEMVTEDGIVELADTSPPAFSAFYRVVIEKP